VSHIRVLRGKPLTIGGKLAIRTGTDDVKRSGNSGKQRGRGKKKNKTNSAQPAGRAKGRKEGKKIATRAQRRQKKGVDASPWRGGNGEVNHVRERREGTQSARGQNTRALKKIEKKPLREKTKT